MSSNLLADLFRAATPSLSQGLSLSRASIQGLGAGIFTSGASDGNWKVMLVGALIWGGAAAWGIGSWTHKAILGEATAIPGVVGIIAAPHATDGVAQAVADPALPVVTAGTPEAAKMAGRLK